MQQLSDEFLDSCRREDGRILRGENMTRIETFVDAAFAFVFTMLVISIDEIPKTVPELLDLSQDIPAFLISATTIGLIWIAHTVWSRTFGLQNRATLYLSLGLVMLVPEVINLLIYFGLGLMVRSLFLIALYQNSLRQRKELVLSDCQVVFPRLLE